MSAPLFRVPYGVKGKNFLFAIDMAKAAPSKKTAKTAKAAATGEGKKKKRSHKRVVSLRR